MCLVRLLKLNTLCPLFYCELLIIVNRILADILIGASLSTITGHNACVCTNEIVTTHSFSLYPNFCEHNAQGTVQE